MSRGTKDIRHMLHSRRSSSQTNLGGRVSAVWDGTEQECSSRGGIRPSRPQSVLSYHRDCGDGDEENRENPAPFGVAHHSHTERKLMQLSQDDQEMIRILRRKIEEQQEELSKRHDNVGSIQRNFETLNRLFQAEKTKSSSLEQELENAVRRIEQLLVNADSLNELQAKYDMLHAEHCNLLQNR